MWISFLAGSVVKDVMSKEMCASMSATPVSLSDTVPVEVQVSPAKVGVDIVIAAPGYLLCRVGL